MTKIDEARMTPVMPRACRPAARIILTDPACRVLLFRFDAPDRPPFWVLPGGAVEPGESYPAAARRELAEETGLDRDCGREIARRVVDFVTLAGIPVTADERYFHLAVDAFDPDPAGHTAEERAVMTQWRWFGAAELTGWPEPIYPEDLTLMLEALHVPAG